jgi:hypothetical protein
MKRKYNFKEDYFGVIDTEEKAYWLGFIAADGYIHINHREVNTTLSLKDKDHLIKFLKCLNHSDLNILKIHKQAYSSEYKETEKVTLRLSSKKMNEDLRNLGLNNNKSSTLKQIPISDGLKHHMIRGFFDGNGGVCYNKVTDKRGKDIKIRYVPRIIFSGTHDFLKFINESLPVQCKTILWDKRTKDSYVLDYRSITRYKQIQDYLFKDASIWLDRKKEKFNLINKSIGLGLDT